MTTTTGLRFHTPINGGLYTDDLLPTSGRSDGIENLAQLIEHHREELNNPNNEKPITEECTSFNKGFIFGILILIITALIAALIL